MTQYKKGMIVKGTITGIEKYGIFVSLDNFYSGLVHISEICDGYVADVSNYGCVGEVIYVKVVDVDDTTNHLKLSIKDIDYRISKTEFKSKINEIGNGFGDIKDNLPIWIEKKIKEIEKSKKKY